MDVERRAKEAECEDAMATFIHVEWRLGALGPGSPPTLPLGQGDSTRLGKGGRDGSTRFGQGDSTRLGKGWKGKRGLALWESCRGPEKDGKGVDPLGVGRRSETEETRGTFDISASGGVFA